MRRDSILGLMERLDSKYAVLKEDSKDASESVEARAAASSVLADRKTLLQPTYKQTVLPHADLHEGVYPFILSTNFSLSCVGRMEAKGCAKPAVWKDARRHFHWAVRGHTVKPAALAQIAEATPEPNLEYRARFLYNLAGIDAETDMISRLQQIQMVANDINAVSRDFSSVYGVSLEPLSPLCRKLLLEYAAEYEKYCLDEIVVVAIAL